ARIQDSVRRLIPAVLVQAGCGYGSIHRRLLLRFHSQSWFPPFKRVVSVLALFFTIMPLRLCVFARDSFFSESDELPLLKSQNATQNLLNLLVLRPKGRSGLIPLHSEAL